MQSYYKKLTNCIVAYAFFKKLYKKMLYLEIVQGNIEKNSNFANSFIKAEK